MMHIPGWLVIWGSGNTWRCLAVSRDWSLQDRAEVVSFGATLEEPRSGWVCRWCSLPSVCARGPARSQVKFLGYVAHGQSGQQMGPKFSLISPVRSARLRQSCFMSHAIWWLLLSLFLWEKLWAASWSQVQPLFSPHRVKESAGNTSVSVKCVVAPKYW